MSAVTPMHATQTHANQHHQPRRLVRNNHNNISALNLNLNSSTLPSLPPKSPAYLAGPSSLPADMGLPVGQTSPRTSGHSSVNSPSTQLMQQVRRKSWLAGRPPA